MSSVALAQAGSSSVRGIINDLQGRPVAGATVSLINEQKNFSRTQTTNDNGSYVFTAVPRALIGLGGRIDWFKKSSISERQASLILPNIDIQLRLEMFLRRLSVTAGGDLQLTQPMRPSAIRLNRDVLQSFRLTPETSSDFFRFSRVLRARFCEWRKIRPGEHHA